MGNRWWRLAAPLLALCCGLVYGPAVAATYGHTDDYWWLLQAGQVGMDAWRNSFSDEGRPLLGAFIRVAFGACDFIGDIRWIRLGGVVCLFLLGLQVLRLCIRSSLSEVEAFAVALAITTTPAAVVHAGCASSAFLAAAAVVGLAAGEWCFRACRDAPWRSRWPHVTGAAVVLLAGLAVSQTTAAFFLLPALVYFFAQPTRGHGRAGWLTVGLFLTTAVVHVVIDRAALQQLLPETAIAGHADLAWSVLANWSVFLPESAQVGTVLITAAAALWSFVAMLRRADRRAAATATLLAAAAVALAGAPLVFAGDAAPFRTLGALYACVLVLVFFGCRDLFRRLPDRIARSWQVVCIGAALTACCGARYFLREGIVKPQSREAELYRGYLRAHFQTMPEALVFVAPKWNTITLSRVRVCHEFGGTSSQLYWISRGLLAALLNEQFGLSKRAATRTARTRLEVMVVPSHPAREARGYPIVDGVEVLTGCRRTVAPEHRLISTVDNDYFGVLDQYRDDWYWSAWFGAFRMHEWPAVDHPQLGQLQCAGSGGNDFWFHHRHLGWIWTSPDCFPNVFAADDQAWYVFQRADDRGQQFLVSKTGKIRVFSEP